MNELAAPKVSIVSPVYCCADCLRDLCARIAASMAAVGEDYEIVLIDDASPDAAWSVLRELCAADSRIKAISLSRNFGQHYAIAAGLEVARGDWVVVMDCDLQDRPEEIPNLLAKAREGYDVVFGERVERRDGWFKRTSSRMFIAFLNYLSGANYDYRTANFGVYNRAVIDAILSMGDQSRFFPVMVRWTGFRRTSVPVQHDARGNGGSAYTPRRLMRLALDIILSYSDKPLRLVAALGIFVSVIALGMTGFSIYRYVHGDVSVAGYTSVIASMWLLAGVTLFCMGVIGLYVGRVFESVKFRPVFIVRERLNL
ncbi:MAG: glycosyltransferase family 2 protein [Rhodanobacteraceae bacterium]